jgi:hypothetical protein
MNDVFVRRIAFAMLAAVIAGGALRLWAVISFPTLDIYDNGPLWIGVAGCVVCVGALWLLLAAAPLSTRLGLSPVALAAGWSLCFGAASVANGVFDRSPTRWLAYTVAEHRHGGRASVVTLQRSGSDGPAWLRLRERRETVDLPIGTSVAVPVRNGALDVAWRPGPVVGLPRR